MKTNVQYFCKSVVSLVMSVLFHGLASGMELGWFWAWCVVWSFVAMGMSIYFAIKCILK